MAKEFDGEIGILFIVFSELFGHISPMSDDQPKKKTELYGQGMEMLGEDLEKSNAMLGTEAKNDQLGDEALEAMQALLKNKKSADD